MKILAIRSILVSISLAFCIASSARGQCSLWKDGFNAPGVDGDVYAPVFALTVYDDGGGPALYVGGNLESAGNVAAKNLAKWDGTSWSTGFGGGVDGTVRALTVFDDGTGAALYVAGKFANAGGVPAINIARWNGSSWSALGGGAGDPNDLFQGVDALAVFDDGSGPALYVAGYLTTAGGVNVGNVARWDGSSWSAVSIGTDGVVQALAVFDDGSGPALYAGGSFDRAGGFAASTIAKWNGASWSALGSGLAGGGGGPHVYALQTFDDGAGPALFVAGHFTNAGSTNANYIAKWDGSNWSALGSGMAGGSIYPLVSSLSVFDDGTGAGLYACGIFATAGGVSTQNIARWNGSSWSALASGIDIYYTALFVPSAMCVFDDGGGPSLIVGGDCRSASGTMANHLAQWRSSAWNGVGPSRGTNGPVNALTDFNDGTGPALYAGGVFTQAGSASANNIAKWNGSTWRALSTGTDGSVAVERAFDDGSGSKLYVGGLFAHAGGVSVSNIARWNGSNWSALGSGTNSTVMALEVFDDGSGSALYVGGNFTTVGGASANRIARWNGSGWSTLATGVSGTVNALAVYDDGAGPALYVGGSFTVAAGQGVHHLAKWNAGNWSDVGGGVSSDVVALTVLDDGTGPALYVGGGFSTAGSSALPVNGLARWNGTTWASLGSGLSNLSLSLATLAAFDDGAGPALYVGGQLTGVSGVAANHVARWDGAHWFPLEQGLDATVNVLAAIDVGGTGTPELYAGGLFMKAGSVPSWHLAKWVACPHTGTRLCFGDGSGAVCPCGNSGAAGHGCENSSATGGALLDAGGTASLSADSVWFTSSGERGTSLSIFLQGTAEIAPLFFGDGLRCTGGSLHRLFVKSAVYGIAYAPQFGDPTLSARSAALGDAIAAGTSRVYQVYYRDPEPTFCPPAAGNSFNISNAVKIQWVQ